MDIEFRHTYIHTYIQTDRQTDRQMDRETDRHTSKGLFDSNSIYTRTGRPTWHNNPFSDIHWSSRCSSVRPSVCRQRLTCIRQTAPLFATIRVQLSLTYGNKIITCCPSATDEIRRAFLLTSCALSVERYAFRHSCCRGHKSFHTSRQNSLF